MLCWWNCLLLLLELVFLGNYHLTLSRFFYQKMKIFGYMKNACSWTSFEPFITGEFVPDFVVAVLIGIITGWCMGPLLPICGHWLARKSILQFLLHLSVVALALSSQFFPYSVSAPKRAIFQHTFHTAGIDSKHVCYFSIIIQMPFFPFLLSNFYISCGLAGSSQIVEATYDFSVVDSNSLLFLFKHAPEVARELNISSEFSFQSAKLSKRQNWMASFMLFSMWFFFFVSSVFYSLENVGASESRLLTSFKLVFIPLKRCSRASQNVPRLSVKSWSWFWVLNRRCQFSNEHNDIC